MSKITNLPTTYINWGPYVMRTKMPDYIVKKLKTEGKKAKESYNHKLAGHLDNQFLYPQKIQEWFYSEVHPIITAYRNGHCKYHGIEDLNVDFLAEDLWVNYMKAGEWNPSHNHTGDISCVTYLKVPKEISEENEKGEHTKVSNTPSAGRIEFQFGNVGMPYSSGGYIRTPEERKIFFFPAALSHMVYPFKSDTERVSMSVNFSDRIHAQETLKQVGER